MTLSLSRKQKPLDSVPVSIFVVILVADFDKYRIWDEQARLETTDKEVAAYMGDNREMVNNCGVNPHLDYSQLDYPQLHKIDQDDHKFGPSQLG